MNNDTITHLRGELQSIYDIAGWHYDDEVNPHDPSPEDAVAHNNGLIRQRVLAALSLLDAEKPAENPNQQQQ